MNLKLKLMTISLSLTLSLQANSATLAEIYEMALTSDPELGTAEAQYKVTRQQKKLARSAFLPLISVGGQTTDGRRTMPVSGYVPTQRFNQHSWQARITQPVFRLDAWFAYKQVQDLDAEATANLAASQLAAIIRSGEAYFSILERQDQLTAAIAERNAVQRQQEQVQQRFDVGLVAITDVLESTAALDSATVNMIDAEGARDISFERLVSLTGNYINEISALSADFPVAFPIPNDENAWVDAALNQNFSIVAAKERVNAAQKQIQIARSAHLPSIDANVSWNHSATGGGDFFGSKTDQRTMSLSMTIPVFSGGRTNAQVKQAVYGLEARQKQLDQTQKQVVEQTRSLFSAINTDVARVSARSKGIDSSQSALDAVQTGYEVGTRNIVDVLQAQRGLYNAQSQYASARYKYILDTLRLKQLAGTLSPEDIEELNQFVVGTDSVRKDASQ